jgi:hypothetical protein
MNNELPSLHRYFLCPAEDALIEELREIYLVAGLSLDDALRSALADYAWMSWSASA